MDFGISGGFDTAHAAARLDFDFIFILVLGKRSPLLNCLFLVGFFLNCRAYDRAAIKFRGVDADINFNLTDYEDDLKQVVHGFLLLILVFFS